MNLLLMFLAMLVLAVLGIPLVYSIGLPASVVVLSKGYNLAFISGRTFKGIDSFVLSSIPFFLLAADLLAAGGLMKRIVKFCSVLVGHIRGSLAQVNILASLFFAGIQGTCTADSAAIGGMLIPAMIEDGYHKDISVVVTATSSCLGPIIPPSVLMITYAYLTETSVAKLFLGGAVPGVLIALGLMGITHYYCIKRGYPKQRDKMATPREVLDVGKPVIPAFLVPIVIVVGIVGGVFTPTESAVIACVIALITGALVYRELSLSAVAGALMRTAKTTAAIFCIVAVSSVFSEVVTRGLLVEKLRDFLMATMGGHPTLLLGAMVIVALLLGMAIDTTPLLIMVAGPMSYLGSMMGLDPIHVGVVLAMACLFGTLTPPVAVLLALDCGIAGIQVRETFGVLYPYLAVLLGVLFLCVLFPQLVVWLPGLLT